MGFTVDNKYFAHFSALLTQADTAFLAQANTHDRKAFVTSFLSDIDHRANHWSLNNEGDKVNMKFGDTPVTISRELFNTLRCMTPEQMNALLDKHDHAVSTYTNTLSKLDQMAPPLPADEKYKAMRNATVLRDTVLQEQCEDFHDLHASKPDKLFLEDGSRVSDIVQQDVSGLNPHTGKPRQWNEIISLEVKDPKLQQRIIESLDTLEANPLYTHMLHEKIAEQNMVLECKLTIRGGQKNEFDEDHYRVMLNDDPQNQVKTIDAQGRVGTFSFDQIVAHELAHSFFQIEETSLGKTYHLDELHSMQYERSFDTRPTENRINRANYLFVSDLPAKDEITYGMLSQLNMALNHEGYYLFVPADQRDDAKQKISPIMEQYGQTQAGLDADYAINLEIEKLRKFLHESKTNHDLSDRIEIPTTTPQKSSWHR